MTYLVSTDDKTFLLDDHETQRALEYVEAGIDVDVFFIKRAGKGSVTLKPVRVKAGNKASVTYEATVLEATGEGDLATIERKV